MTWQPIETAPKGDGEGNGPNILCYCPDMFGRGGRVSVGFWDREQYKKSPRPHWGSRWGMLGKQNARDQQPTHWMPLPAATEAV